MSLSGFDLSVVLMEQLAVVLEMRQSLTAMVKVLKESDPQFSKKYEAALATLAKDVSAQPNPQWVVFVQNAFLKLRDG
jgi:cytochrome c556